MAAALWLAKPKVQTWFNGALTVLWLVMMPVTLVIPVFRTSVLWIAFISAWALFATHLGAWIAALVNVKAERIDDRTEQGAHFARIEEAEERLLLQLDQGHERILAVLATLGPAEARR